jgi:hypothetical protein
LAQGKGHRSQDTGHRTQVTGRRKQDTGYRSQDTRLRTKETRRALGSRAGRDKTEDAMKRKQNKSGLGNREETEQRVNKQ